MITPRQFEEKMQDLKTEYKEDPETMMKLMAKLMADTLDTWGYQAGTDIYRKAL